MKLTRIITVMVIALGFGLNTVDAQALKFEGRKWTLHTNYGVYTSYNNKGIINPAINVVHKQLFIIDKEDPLVPEKGVEKINFQTWFIAGGYLCHLYAEGHVYSDGRVWIVFHYNGKDRYQPDKDDD